MYDFRFPVKARYAIFEEIQKIFFLFPTVLKFFLNAL